MKKLLTLSFALFIISFLNGQEVTNQTEQIKLLKTGKYLTYNVNSKNGNDWYPVDIDAELTSVEQEDNFKEHKYLYFKIGETGSPWAFIPDNMAFPVTLAQLNYMGNDKLKKEVGYVPYEITRTTKRFVVLDGIIFGLSLDFDPKDPETFKPYRLYVHESYGKENKSKDGEKEKKKKKKSLFKKLSSLANVASSPAVKKLNSENLVDKVVSYLTLAIKKQEEVYPKWKSVALNKMRLNNVEKKRKLMYKALNDYNEAYKKTDEWKRIQENNRRANAAAKRNNTTIKNATGRVIYIYEEGSYNSSRISNGNSQSFGCNNTYYYTFSGNSKWSAGTKISGTSCGSTATVR